MAWTVTLAEMLTELRSRGGYRRSTALTDSILTSFLNYAIAEVHDLLVKHCPDAITRSSDITPDSGASTVDMPEDFYKLVLLGHIDGDDVRPLRPVSVRTALEQPTPGTYVLHSDNVELPSADETFTLRLYYIPHATKLVDSDDVYNGANGYEDLVYEHALRRCKARDRLPTQEHDAEIARLEKRLLSAMEARDQSEPMYLEDLGEPVDLL